MKHKEFTPQTPQPPWLAGRFHFSTARRRKTHSSTHRTDHLLIQPVILTCYGQRQRGSERRVSSTAAGAPLRRGSATPRTEPSLSKPAALTAPRRPQVLVTRRSSTT